MSQFRINKIGVYLNTIRSQKHPLLFLAGKFMLLTGLNRYKVFSFEGYRIRFSNSAMGLSIFMNKNDREEERQLLKDILRPGDNFIDIGANIGTLTIPAAICCENGKVISIEAHPHTYDLLKENIALNRLGNIAAINKAMGNKSGKITFSNISSDDQNKITKEKEGIQVDMLPLDSLEELKGIDEVALLKIDVEGFEKFVLEGADKTLDITQAVYLEVWDSNFKYYDYAVADIILLLKEKGFSLFRFLKADVISPLKDNFTAATCENILAVKDPAWLTGRTAYQIAE